MDPSAVDPATAGRLHPASIILFCLAVLVAASSSAGGRLYLVCALLVTVASVMAKSHFLVLLRRSRWLMVTIVVLFGWMTPGTPLPLLPGASAEGLVLAANNLACLVMAICTAAWLLTRLPSPQLVAGLRALLAPLGLLGIPPDRIAVRIALTLEQVEATRGTGDGVAGGMVRTLSLPAGSWGLADLLLGAASFALFVVAWLP